MIAKHTIVKIKHRENTNNYPTERLTCMMLILDIEKANTAKENKDGKLRPAERDPGQPWKTSWLCTVT